MKLNPVYQKELKTGVRTIKMSMMIFFYNLILAFISLLAFYVYFSLSGHQVNFSNILVIYTFIACLEFGLILFVVPAMTSSAISGERERQTLEILLTTTLKPIQIITGKLCASISQIIMLVVSSLPILSLVFTVGGIRLKDLLMLMFICIATAIFVGSIGIFYSTVFKRTVPATVLTYGTLILLVLATVIGLYVAQVLLIEFYDKQFYTVNTVTNATYNPPRLGYMVLVLLWNPAVSIGAMLVKQFGEGTAVVNELLREFGVNNAFIGENWFAISVVVQLATAVFLLWASAKKLNPLTSSKEKKRKKQQKKRNKKKSRRLKAKL